MIPQGHTRTRGCWWWRVSHADGQTVVDSTGTHTRGWWWRVSHADGMTVVDGLPSLPFFFESHTHRVIMTSSFGRPPPETVLVVLPPAEAVRLATRGDVPWDGATWLGRIVRLVTRGDVPRDGLTWLGRIGGCGLQPHHRTGRGPRVACCPLRDLSHLPPPAEAVRLVTRGDAPRNVVTCLGRISLICRRPPRRCVW